MTAFDLLAVGTPVVDVFAKVDDNFLTSNGLVKNSTNFIPRDKLDAMEAGLSDSIVKKYPGDNARNVVETVSRLGGKAAYAGRIGTDAEGELFEKSLMQFGVASYLEKKAQRTGKILSLITNEAERTFAADLAESENYALDKLFGFEGTKFVYATSITMLSTHKIGKATHTLFLRARARKIKTVLSLESPAMIHANRVHVKELMRESDYIFMNEEERGALGVSQAFLSHLGSTVFLKHGAQGSTVYEHGKKPVSVPAVKVKTVVDTTGAGDAYAAGVIYGLSRGLPAAEAAQIGAKTGALSVTIFGASLPDSFPIKSENE